MELIEQERLMKNIHLLSKMEIFTKDISTNNSSIPSIESLKRIVLILKNIIFPGFFEGRDINTKMLPYYIGVELEELHELLTEQINKDLALEFIDKIPELKRVLYTDVKAIFDNDPAAKNYGEIIFCYPGMQAMINYRIAHILYKMDIPIIPRIITEMAHSITGIDIHPGASIGEYFCIDHGTGVVIGETCIIGNHVTIYQGVTLGAKNFTYDTHGNPINLPRHPILEDNVTIYSNSTILGRITIGKNTIVGGNIWLTLSVPANSKIIQKRALIKNFNKQNNLEDGKDL